MQLGWYSCPKCFTRLPSPIPLFSSDQSQLTGIQYHCSCGWAMVELPRKIDIIRYHRWKQEQYD